MKDKYKALVLGATGLVGKALLKRLTEDSRYEQITCLIRRPFNNSELPAHTGKIQPIVVDFEQLDAYQGYFNVEHVYVCLGTTIKKAKTKQAFRKVDFEYVHAAAQLAGLQQCRSFVWISSVGANAKSSSFYLRVKGELEDAILNMPVLKNASAVRPSLLLGERNENRIAEQVGITFAKALSGLMVGKLEKYRPVQAHDVAAQMIRLQVF